MKRLYSRKLVAAAALALGGLAAASAAHARSDVQFWIGVQPAQVHLQPAPVYIHPRPVLVQPRPVYVQPQPVFVQPAPVYMHPGRRYRAADHGNPWGWNDRSRDGGPDRYYRDHGRGQHPGWRQGHDRDRDGDGVRNRHDRFPDNPYRY